MSEMTVADLMSPDVVTLDRNDELGLADQVMSLGRIRHLPVLDEDGAVAGVLSQRDLFRSGLIRALGYGTAAEHKLLKVIRVKEVMTSHVETVAPSAPIRDAARKMVEAKIGCLPVVDGDSLVGLLTESDFVRVFAEGLK